MAGGRGASPNGIQQCSAVAFNGGTASVNRRTALLVLHTRAGACRRSDAILGQAAEQRRKQHLRQACVGTRHANVIATACNMVATACNIVAASAAALVCQACVRAPRSHRPRAVWDTMPLGIPSHTPSLTRTTESDTTLLSQPLMSSPCPTSAPGIGTGLTAAKSALELASLVAQCRVEQRMHGVYRLGLAVRGMNGVRVVGRCTRQCNPEANADRSHRVRRRV